MIKMNPIETERRWSVLFDFDHALHSRRRLCVRNRCLIRFSCPVPGTHIGLRHECVATACSSRLVSRLGGGLGRACEPGNQAPFSAFRPAQDPLGGTSCLFDMRSEAPQRHGVMMTVAAGGCVSHGPVPALSRSIPSAHSRCWASPWALRARARARVCGMGAAGAAVWACRGSRSSLLWAPRGLIAVSKAARAWGRGCVTPVSRTGIRPASPWSNRIHIAVSPVMPGRRQGQCEEE